MNTNIDVKKIMSDIREEIKVTGRDKEPLSFIDHDTALDHSAGDCTLEEALDYISYNYEVKPYEVLQGNKIAVFIKRIIRRLTSFLIMPIVAQQNTLNYHFYKVSEAIERVKKDNDEYQKRIDTLEKKLAEMDSKEN